MSGHSYAARIAALELEAATADGRMVVLFVGEAVPADVDPDLDLVVYLPIPRRVTEDDAEVLEVGPDDRPAKRRPL